MASEARIGGTALRWARTGEGIQIRRLNTLNDLFFVLVGALFFGAGAMATLGANLPAPGESLTLGLWNIAFGLVTLGLVTVVLVRRFRFTKRAPEKVELDHTHLRFHGDPGREIPLLEIETFRIEHRRVGGTMSHEESSLDAVLRSGEVVPVATTVAAHSPDDLEALATALNEWAQKH